MLLGILICLGFFGIILYISGLIFFLVRRKYWTPNFCQAVAVFPVLKEIRNHKIWWWQWRYCLIINQDERWEGAPFVLYALKEGVFIKEFIFYFGLKPLAIFIPWYELSEPQDIKVSWMVPLKNPVAFRVKGSPMILVVEKGTFTSTENNEFVHVEQK